jgi:hypothetical protein
MKCNKCGEDKSLEQFSKHPQCKSGVEPQCKDCNNRYSRDWRAARRQERIGILHQLFDPYECEKCGNTDERVLQFHHLTGKDFKISDGLSGKHSTSVWLSEVEKCILLCANCHIIAHS